MSTNDGDVRIALDLFIGLYDRLVEIVTALAASVINRAPIRW